MSERHAPSLLITSNSAEYPALADFEAINEVPRASRIGNQATNYLESHASVSYSISDGHPTSYARQEWRYRVDLSFDLRAIVSPCVENVTSIKGNILSNSLSNYFKKRSAIENRRINEPIIYRRIYPVKGTSCMHSEVELSTLTCCFDGGFITRCNEYFVVIAAHLTFNYENRGTSFIDQRITFIVQ